MEKGERGWGRKGERKKPKVKYPRRAPRRGNPAYPSVAPAFRRRVLGVSCALFVAHLRSVIISNLFLYFLLLESVI